jgi:dolichol-phosphate mannosyltransferase
MEEMSMKKNENDYQVDLTTTPGQKANIAVVIPTYNEEKGIERVINEIETLNLNLSIVVIDDSSRDNTRREVRKLMTKYRNLELIERPAKLGYGTAIEEGFEHVLSKRPLPEYVITIDADYSYDPKNILRLVDAAMKGNDLVIGSRYSKGSKIVGNNLTASLFHRLLNLIMSIMLRINVSDSTSGFRCYSNRFLKNILGDLSSETYEIQIETLRKALLGNFKWTEVPTEFINRKYGKPKLTLSRSAGLMSLLLLGRKDRVIEDNKIKLNVEYISNMAKKWKINIDNLIAERKR